MVVLSLLNSCAALLVCFVGKGGCFNTFRDEVSSEQGSSSTSSDVIGRHFATLGGDGLDNARGRIAEMDTSASNAYPMAYSAAVDGTDKMKTSASNAYLLGHGVFFVSGYALGHGKNANGSSHGQGAYMYQNNGSLLPVLDMGYPVTLRYGPGGQVTNIINIGKVVKPEDLHLGLSESSGSSQSSYGVSGQSDDNVASSGYGNYNGDYSSTDDYYYDSDSDYKGTEYDYYEYDEDTFQPDSYSSIGYEQSDSFALDVPVNLPNSQNNGPSFGVINNDFIPGTVTHKDEGYKPPEPGFVPPILSEYVPPEKESSYSVPNPSINKGEYKAPSEENVPFLMENTEGYEVPNGVYKAPEESRGVLGDGYIAPDNSYMLPMSPMDSGGYNFPTEGYMVPDEEYGIPDESSKSPNSLTNDRNLELPSATYAAPNEEYKAPSKSYGAPVESYKVPDEGYEAPKSEYKVPSEGYEAPAEGYKVPDDKYRAPNKAYEVPSGGYQAPSKKYQVPEEGYAVPNIENKSPGKEYKSPDEGYTAPSEGYKTPSEGYKAPSEGYKTPSEEYKTPSKGYKIPSEGYKAPSEEYTAPSEGYKVPSEGYKAPSEGFKAPNEVYKAPSEGYIAPSEGYNLPSEKYKAPSESYEVPSIGYKVPSEGYKPPNQRYSPPNSKTTSEKYSAPNESYKAPNEGYETPSQGYKPPNFGYQTTSSEYRSPSEGFKAPIDALNEDYIAPDEVYKIPTEGYRPPDEGYKAPNEGYRPPDEGYKMPNAGYKPPKEEYAVPSKGYDSPKEKYSPPNKVNGIPDEGYTSPAESYSPPSVSPNPPNIGYKQPSKEYSPPNAPNKSYQQPKTEFKPSSLFNNEGFKPMGPIGNVYSAPNNGEQGSKDVLVSSYDGYIQPDSFSNVGSYPMSGYSHQGFKTTELASSDEKHNVPSEPRDSIARIPNEIRHPDSSAEEGENASQSSYTNIDGNGGFNEPGVLSSGSTGSKNTNSIVSTEHSKLPESDSYTSFNANLGLSSYTNNEMVNKNYPQTVSNIGTVKRPASKQPISAAVLISSYSTIGENKETQSTKNNGASKSSGQDSSYTSYGSSKGTSANQDTLGNFDSEESSYTSTKGSGKPSSSSCDCDEEKEQSSHDIASGNRNPDQSSYTSIEGNVDENSPAIREANEERIPLAFNQDPSQFGVYTKKGDKKQDAPSNTLDSPNKNPQVSSIEYFGEFAFEDSNDSSYISYKDRGVPSVSFASDHNIATIDFDSSTEEKEKKQDEDCSYAGDQTKAQKGYTSKTNKGIYEAPAPVIGNPDADKTSSYASIDYNQPQARSFASFDSFKGQVIDEGNRETNPQESFINNVGYSQADFERNGQTRLQSDSHADNRGFIWPSFDRNPDSAQLNAFVSSSQGNFYQNENPYSRGSNVYSAGKPFENIRFKKNNDPVTISTSMSEGNKGRPIIDKGVLEYYMVDTLSDPSKGPTLRLIPRDTRSQTLNTITVPVSMEVSSHDLAPVKDLDENSKSTFDVVSANFDNAKVSQTISTNTSPEHQEIPLTDGVNEIGSGFRLLRFVRSRNSDNSEMFNDNEIRNFNNHLIDTVPNSHSQDERQFTPQKYEFKSPSSNEDLYIPNYKGYDHSNARYYSNNINGQYNGNNPQLISDGFKQLSNAYKTTGSQENTNSFASSFHESNANSEKVAVVHLGSNGHNNVAITDITSDGVINFDSSGNFSPAIQHSDEQGNQNNLLRLDEWRNIHPPIKTSNKQDDHSQELRQFAKEDVAIPISAIGNSQGGISDQVISYDLKTEFFNDGLLHDARARSLDFPGLGAINLRNEDHDFHKFPIPDHQSKVSQPLHNEKENHNLPDNQDISFDRVINEIVFVPPDNHNQRNEHFDEQTNSVVSNGNGNFIHDGDRFNTESFSNILPGNSNFAKENPPQIIPQTIFENSQGTLGEDVTSNNRRQTGRLPNIQPGIITFSGELPRDFTKEPNHVSTNSPKFITNLENGGSFGLSSVKAFLSDSPQDFSGEFNQGNIRLVEFDQERSELKSNENLQNNFRAPQNPPSLNVPDFSNHQRQEGDELLIVADQNFNGESINFDVNDSSETQLDFIVSSENLSPEINFGQSSVDVKNLENFRHEENSHWDFDTHKVKASFISDPASLPAQFPLNQEGSHSLENIESRGATNIISSPIPQFGLLPLAQDNTHSLENRESREYSSTSDNTDIFLEENNCGGDWIPMLRN